MCQSTHVNIHSFSCVKNIGEKSTVPVPHMAFFFWDSAITTQQNWGTNGMDYFCHCDHEAVCLIDWCMFFIGVLSGPSQHSASRPCEPSVRSSSLYHIQLNSCSFFFLNTTNDTFRAYKEGKIKDRSRCILNLFSTLRRGENNE